MSNPFDDLARKRDQLQQEAARQFEIWAKERERAMSEISRVFGAYDEMVVRVLRQFHKALCKGGPPKIYRPSKPESLCEWELRTDLGTEWKREREGYEWCSQNWQHEMKVVLSFDNRGQPNKFFCTDEAYRAATAETDDVTESGLIRCLSELRGRIYTQRD